MSEISKWQRHNEICKLKLTKKISEAKNVNKKHVYREEEKSENVSISYKKKFKRNAIREYKFRERYAKEVEKTLKLYSKR